MQKLNFPNSSVRLESVGGQRRIFESVRKKWLVLTPEEWVRQHLIKFLIEEKDCPVSLIAVERGLDYNGLSWRSDLVLYNRLGLPVLLAECKAPEVSIDQSVFDQAARYNLILQVPFLLITNGIKHFCCLIDISNQSWKFLGYIPTNKEITKNFQ